MTLRDESEHVPDFPFVPLRGMNRWRNGRKQALLASQLQREQYPGLACCQGKQVLKLVESLAGTEIDGQQRREAATQLVMQISGDLWKLVVIDPILHQLGAGCGNRHQSWKSCEKLLFDGVIRHYMLRAFDGST